jgi:hypothetical protein
MGALSVSQLLENAQEKGISINLETAAVENQQLLEAVEKMSLDAIPKTQAKKLGHLVSNCVGTVFDLLYPIISI